MDAERWAWIPGQEGRYEVSDQGRVRSHLHHPKPYLIKLQPDARGYVRVFISISGHYEWRWVHRLVATAFLPNPERNTRVNHKNGVKDDNRPENLELWIRPQPSGMRASDAVTWAREILGRYGNCDPSWRIEPPY